MLKERYPAIVESIYENLKPLNGKGISLDIDAVTQATYVKSLNFASHYLKRAICKDQLITYWELDKIARQNGLSEEQSLEFTKAIWNQDEVYRNSPLIPGVEKLLTVFNEIGIPYIFVSSRPPIFMETTKNWYAEKLPWVNSENIFLGRKEGMHGGVYKSNEINKHNIGLHIEDASEEAVEIVNSTATKILLVPQPWNNNDRFENERIKKLGAYTDSSGVWPVMKFLVSKDSKIFLSS